MHNTYPPQNTLLIPQQWYDDLAIDIFNNFKLQRQENRGWIDYNFSDIEIYASYNKQGDPYCHCHNNQLQNTFNGDPFYFHYSGADIVMGNSSTNFYCGILIRGIEDNANWIYGPRKVAYTKYPTQYNLQLKSLTSPNHFELQEDPIEMGAVRSDLIFQIPRYNLDISPLQKAKPHCLDYFKMPLRYVRLPDNYNTLPKNSLPNGYDEIVKKYFL